MLIFWFWFFFFGFGFLLLYPNPYPPIPCWEVKWGEAFLRVLGWYVCLLGHTNLFYWVSQALVHLYVYLGIVLFNPLLPPPPFFSLSVILHCIVNSMFNCKIYKHLLKKKNYTDLITPFCAYRKLLKHVLQVATNVSQDRTHI